MARLYLLVLLASFALLMSAAVAENVRPTFLFHGLKSGTGEFSQRRGFDMSFIEIMRKHLPKEAKIINIPIYSNQCEKDWPLSNSTAKTVGKNCKITPHMLSKSNNSFVPLWIQVNALSKYIERWVKSEPKAFENGYNLICHGQGGLICRTFLQTYRYHRVHTFISLAGILNGASPPKPFTDFLSKNMGHDLTSVRAQTCLGVANFYNNPKLNHRFLNVNTLLPLINSQLEMSEAKKRRWQVLGFLNEAFPRESLHVDLDPYRFARNLRRVKKMLLFGSPEDEAVYPFQTFFFDYVDSDGKSIPATKYLAGLKIADYLDDPTRVMRHQIRHILHDEWLHREDIFKKYMLQYL